MIQHIRHYAVELVFLQILSECFYSFEFFSPLFMSGVYGYAYKPAHLYHIYCRFYRLNSILSHGCDSFITSRQVSQVKYNQCRLNIYISFQISMIIFYKYDFFL